MIKLLIENIIVYCVWLWKLINILNYYFEGKTHTMLGPNPRKVASTPASSSADIPPKTAVSIQAQSTDGGLMVKAMDEIFRHVEQAENPESFKVFN